MRLDHIYHLISPKPAPLRRHPLVTLSVTQQPLEVLFPHTLTCCCAANTDASTCKYRPCTPSSWLYALVTSNLSFHHPLAQMPSGHSGCSVVACHARNTDVMACIIKLRRCAFACSIQPCHFAMHLYWLLLCNGRYCAAHAC